MIVSLEFCNTSRTLESLSSLLDDYKEFLCGLSTGYKLGDELCKDVHVITKAVRPSQTVAIEKYGYTSSNNLQCDTSIAYAQIVLIHKKYQIYGLANFITYDSILMRMSFIVYNILMKTIFNYSLYFFRYRLKSQYQYLQYTSQIKTDFHGEI